jgi:hypothetical protein
MSKLEHIQFIINYIKNMLISQNSKINSIIICCLIIFFYILNISGIYIINWICCIIGIFLSCFGCLVFLYINRIIKLHEQNELELSDIKDTFNKLCSDLAYKNYIILREYDEICDFHYDEIAKECYDDMLSYDPNFGTDNSTMNVKTLITSKIKNDNSNKINTYKWLDKSINKIYNYLKLSDYLSMIEKEDNFKIVDNRIFCNISFDSVLNKKNRAFENILNQLSKTEMTELCKSWEIISLNKSFETLISIPCKWMMYEYRMIFKKLHKTKYFDETNLIFKNDYHNFESIILQIKNSLDSIYKYKIIKRNIINKTNSLYLTYLDLYMNLNIFAIDNLIAINILDLLSQSYNAIFFPIIIGLGLYIMINYVYESIVNINKELINTKFDSNEILNQMNQITLSCANKKFK